MPDSLESPDFHVTLVHGTFARGAPWARADSDFCRTIREGVGQSIVFKTFEWSGRNSHAARLTEGADLAKFIEVERLAYPNAKMAVIAHSHGGNVALYAHRTLAKSVDVRSNIVALATPFVVCRLRPRWVINQIALSVYIVIAGLVTAMMFAGTSRAPAPTSPEETVLMFAAMLGVVVALAFFWRRYANTRRSQLLDQLAWPSDGRINLLTATFRTERATRVVDASRDRR